MDDGVKKIIEEYKAETLVKLDESTFVDKNTYYEINSNSTYALPGGFIKNKVTVSINFPSIEGGSINTIKFYGI